MNSTDRVYHFMMYEPSASTKLRGQVACMFCNKRKLKCTKTKPCRECFKRGRECIYVHELDTNPMASDQEEISKLLRRKDELEKQIDTTMHEARHWEILYIQAKSNLSKCSHDSGKDKNNKKSIETCNVESSLNYMKMAQEAIEVLLPGMCIKDSLRKDLVPRLKHLISIIPISRRSDWDLYLERSSMKSIFLTWEYFIALSIGSHFMGDREATKEFCKWNLKIFYHLVYVRQILIESAIIERFMRACLLFSISLELTGRLFVALSVLNIAFQASYQIVSPKSSETLSMVVVRLALLSVNEYEKAHWTEYLRKIACLPASLICTEIYNAMNALKHKDQCDSREINAINIRLQEVMRKLKSSEMKKNVKTFYKTACSLLLVELQSSFFEYNSPLTSKYHKILNKNLIQCGATSKKLLNFYFNGLIAKWSNPANPKNEGYIHVKTETITDTSTVTSNYIYPNSLIYEENLRADMVDDYEQMDLEVTQTDMARLYGMTSDYFYGYGNVLCGV